MKKIKYGIKEKHGKVDLDKLYKKAMDGKELILLPKIVILKNETKNQTED